MAARGRSTLPRRTPRFEKSPVTADVELEQIRQSARAAINRYQEQYDKTRNPVLAWRAYRECRGAKLPFPDWVLEYFDRPARVFWAWAGSGRVGAKNLDAEIVDALEMRRPGRKGRGNLFNDVFPDKRTASLACAVYLEVRIQSEKIYQAIEHQAAAAGVSKATVQRAWDQHKEEFRGMEVAIFPEEKRTEALFPSKKG